MTQPAETVVDGDRIDEGRRAWPVMLALLVLGAVIGALVGGLYGASRPTSYSAQTALSVLPDPTIDITNGTNSNAGSVVNLDATAYIQSQLVVINGRQLASTVERRLGLANRPQPTATQIGETYVVQIAVSSPVRREAVATAKAIGSAYDRTRSRQLTSEIDGILTSVRQELANVQRSLVASRVGSRTSTVTPTQTALQTQYEQLLSERSALRATLAQVPQIVTVVSPAAIVVPGLSSAVRDAVAGLVLGAILGVVVLVVYRRTARRVRSVSDLAALGVPVLLPVQARRPLRSRSGAQYWQNPAARLLAARLYADALRQGKPLVVVGASARVGTTHIAESASAALAGRGPVLLVTDRGRPPAGPTVTPQTEPRGAFSQSSPAGRDDVSVFDREPVMQSSVPGVWLLNPDADPDSGTPTVWGLMELVQRASHVGWLVVVDAGAVPTSDLAVQLARVDAAVTLVVGRGVSSPSQVLAATELFDAEGMKDVGAVLNDVPGRLRQALVTRSGRSTPALEVSPRQDGPQLPVDSPLWESLFGEDGDATTAGHRAPEGSASYPHQAHPAG